MNWGKGGGTWAPWRAMALAAACFPSYPLEGSRWGAVEDAGSPWGSSGPCVLGDPAPLNPSGPFPRRGGQPRETEGSAVGQAVRTAV